MSYAMVVYAVPLDELRAVVGSHDEDLLKTIKFEHKPFLEQIDDIFRYRSDEKPFTCLEAVGQIIQGEKFREGWDGLYIYAYEAVCRAIGQELDNRAFQPPIQESWITTVDEYLAQIAFPLRVVNLAWGGSPISIPNKEGIPGCGWWSPDEMRQAQPVLDDLRLDGVDPNLAGALANIIGWLDEALKLGNHCVVGIYS